MKLLIFYERSTVLISAGEHEKYSKMRYPKINILIEGFDLFSMLAILLSKVAISFQNNAPCALTFCSHD